MKKAAPGDGFQSGHKREWPPFNEMGRPFDSKRAETRTAIPKDGRLDL